MSGCRRASERSLVDTDALDRIERTLGERPVRLAPLRGGCIAEVMRADLASGERLAVKLDRGDSARLDIEGRMLDRLRGVVPTPGVIASAPDVLVLAYIEHDGRRSEAGEREAGELLARLHGIASERFGLDEDGLIGPLDQANGWEASWGRFYIERRVGPMARACVSRGVLSPACARVFEDVLGDRGGALAQRLDASRPRPGLIHGDVWSGNVLWDRGRVAALIDPAPYFADPEVELAFIDLFGCFGPAFGEAYRALRPAPAGETRADNAWRRDAHQLYPLLVHARLFDSPRRGGGSRGGGYGASVEATLRRVTDGI